MLVVPQQPSVDLSLDFTEALVALDRVQAALARLSELLDERLDDEPDPLLLPS